MVTMRCGIVFLLSVSLLRLENVTLQLHLRPQVLILVEDGHLHRHRGLGAVGGGNNLPSTGLYVSFRMACT